MILLLGALFMVLDHVGLLWGIPWLRYVGRLAFPLFAYQVVISFRHTSSKPKYMGKLLLCALISQPIFAMMRPGANILFLFAAAVPVLWAWDNARTSPPLPKYRPYMAFALISVVVCLMLMYFRVDYGAYGLLIILLILAAQGDRQTVVPGYVAITLLFWTFGVISWDQIIGVLPLLLPLDQMRRIRTWKYFFYVFYPAHIILLLAVKISVWPQIRQIAKLMR